MTVEAVPTPSLDCEPVTGDTADLLGTLEHVERVAAKALASLQAGTATTGTSALSKIRAEARDAQRRAVAARLGLDYTRDRLPTS